MRFLLLRRLTPKIVAITAIACAHQPSAGEGPLPSSPNPPSSTPAAITLLLPGTPLDVWNKVVQSLTDSSYRAADVDFYHGILTFRSLLTGRLIRVQMSQAHADSVIVLVTGRRYVGDNNREGLILASDSAWPEILATDSAATVITLAAARILTAFSAMPPSPTTTSSAPSQEFALIQTVPDSLLRDLPNGRKGFCKANTVRRDEMLTVDNVNLLDWCSLPPYQAARLAYNTYVLADPSTVPPRRGRRRVLHLGCTQQLRHCGLVQRLDSVPF